MAGKVERIPIRFPGGYPRPYEIQVGRGLLAGASGWQRELGFDRAFLIADARLKKTADRIAASLKRGGAPARVLYIEASEAAKDYRRLFPIFGEMLEHGMDRKGMLLALGGGVIGDLAGFVAAVYLRGIRWTGLPSTLLAQVDSSIGGKTGVNHPLGKNLVGAFHQPCRVVSDTDLLSSLEPRDRLSGLGEIVKYGLAYDARFFAYLEKNHQAILELEPRALQRAIAESARWKAKVVARDEREEKGLRMTLNLGHTLGHAIEGVTGFKRYRHGEAVILGMRLALAISRDRGHLPAEHYDRAERFLSQLSQPPFPRPPVFHREPILSYVRRDKKNESGRLRFVLNRAIGRTVIDDGVSERDIIEAFRRLGLAWRQS